MNLPSKRCAVLACVAAALIVAPAVSHAQGYPNKPIRMVVPWAAGGTSDTVWRIVGPKLSEALGQPVLLDNRPGAASTIGAAIVAAARPDGYTLLATSNVHVLSAHLYKSLPYHAIDDFLPVAQIAQTCSVLVVHPSLPAKTTSEFVSYAKGNPGKIDFSSTGNGSGQQLFMEQIMAATGISLNHVPYKNVGQALAELIGGQVRASVPGVSIVSQHVREGRLRALAVTCAEPSSFLPDVPTLLRIGDEVRFAEENGEQGPQASTVTLAGKHHIPG